MGKKSFNNISGKIREALRPTTEIDPEVLAVKPCIFCTSFQPNSMTCAKYGKPTTQVYERYLYGILEEKMLCLEARKSDESCGKEGKGFVLADHYVPAKKPK